MMIMNSKVFCKLGIHLPIQTEAILFVDNVSGKEVMRGKCPCGIEWMVDTVFPFPFFKVRMITKR